MQNKRSILNIVLAAMFIIAKLSSQNETKKWYFGINAGLDFSTNPPTVLTNNAMSTGEGCASIADVNGNLLFYTSGITIWDKTHNIMANGNGLLGDVSATQSSIIIKQPGNTNIYFVFTQGGSFGANAGLYYSIVDMNLASGNGSVTVKNVTVFVSGTEKLAAVKHKNGADVWILTHDWNNNNFRANLLTSFGFNTTPTISSVGTVISGVIGGTNVPIVGQMKFSPDGKKIGLAVYDAVKSFELYDFDLTTGNVSNPIILGNNFDGAYGCEFSSDGTKFYGGSSADGNIWQWNLCSGTSSNIINSKISVGYSTWASIASFQLAPNGKIYVVKLGNQVLGVIHNPNVAGINCNYVDAGLSLAPKTANNGLPNFTSSYFWQGSQITISTSPGNSICAGETLTLTAGGANSYTWNSITTGTTFIISPTITTTYSVIGTTTSGCNFETVLTVSVSACTNLNSISESDIIKIYPNPVSNDLNFVLNELSTPVKVLLFNTFNLPVLTFELSCSHEKISLNFLPSGLYYLSLEAKNYHKKYKIIKE